MIDPENRGCVSDSSADEPERTKQRLRESIDVLRTAAADAAATLGVAACECVADVIDVVRDKVREQPLAALATTAAATFLLARLTAAHVRRPDGLHSSR